jgi:predicted XRE-type DNA-binding protein
MNGDEGFTVGSGNIYADLGFEEPEVEQTKASLARRVAVLVKARGLTQVEAAGLLGIDQPKVSALLRGRLGGFSVERLMRLLTRLDQDVEIVVQPKATAHAVGRIAVTSSMRREPASPVAAPKAEGRNAGARSS